MTPSPPDRRREGSGVIYDLSSQTTITPACSQISVLQVQTEGNQNQFSNHLVFSLLLDLCHGGETVELNKEIHFTQDPGSVDSYVIINCVNLCAYFALF